MAKGTGSDIPDLEEDLWGFRFYEGAAIVHLLEFLFATCRAGLTQTIEDRIATPEIQGPSHLVLRSLVFNNPMLETTSGWDDWEKAYTSKITGKSHLLKDWNGTYLRETFESFEDFQSAVRLVQTSAIKVTDKDRKWSNQFLFPWNQEQIFPDIKVDRSKSTEEARVALARNHFGHTGELIFLLLTLADGRAGLQEKIDRRFKHNLNVMSKICAYLEGPWARKFQIHIGANSSRLPKDVLSASNTVDTMTKRRANLLCEDLSAVLDLNLTTEDIVDVMARILGIHAACFQMERAMRFAEDPRLKGNGHPYFLCEALQKETSAIRRASKTNFQMNSQLCRQVLLETFNRRFDEIEAAPFGEKRLELFKEKLCLPSNYGTEEERERIIKNPILSDIRKILQERLLKKFDKHCGKFLGDITKSIGLCTRRNTNTFRYAASDELLFSLALATVRGNHMPFRRFLDLLYEKYGLVYEDECRKKMLLSVPNLTGDTADRLESKDLSDNVDRLLEQMMSLGLLRHLSDGCDYVTNPYFRNVEHD